MSRTPTWTAALQPYEDCHLARLHAPAHRHRQLATSPPPASAPRRSAFVDLVNKVQIWGAHDRTGREHPRRQDRRHARSAVHHRSARPPATPRTSFRRATSTSATCSSLYRYENWFYQITMSGKEVKHLAGILRLQSPGPARTAPSTSRAASPTMTSSTAKASPTSLIPPSSVRLTGSSP